MPTVPPRNFNMRALSSGGVNFLDHGGECSFRWISEWQASGFTRRFLQVCRAAYSETVTRLRPDFFEVYSAWSAQEIRSAWVMEGLLKSATPRLMVRRMTLSP